ncbi:hypothetical protein M569_02978, partial [Genlisea aurea]
MLLRRGTRLSSAVIISSRVRFYSAAALLREVDAEPEFKYLDGFPKPDPKHDEIIHAIPRANSGKIISAKERLSGRVPSIVFEAEDGEHGGNKRLISVKTNQIKKLVNHLGQSFFLSRLFNLEVRPDFQSSDIVEKVRVLPRKVSISFTVLIHLHLHAGTDAVLNVTFIRAPSSAWLKVDVPLVYRGDDVSPGLKKGSPFNVIERRVRYLCPADIIPPYIDVDISELDVGQKIVAGDLKVHPALKLLIGMNRPICKVMGTRVYGPKK